MTFYLWRSFKRIRIRNTVFLLYSTQIFQNSFHAYRTYLYKTFFLPIFQRQLHLHHWRKLGHRAHEVQTQGKPPSGKVGTRTVPYPTLPLSPIPYQLLDYIVRYSGDLFYYGFFTYRFLCSFVLSGKTLMFRWFWYNRFLDEAISGA